MPTLISDLLGREKKAISYASPDMPLISRLLINSIELMSGRRSIEKLYEELKNIPLEKNIWDEVFRLLTIRLNIQTEDLIKVPKTGPVIIIANHPFGVLDGMALSYFISQVRRDFHLMVNEVLCREATLGKYFLPIDFRETKEAQKINIQTRATAIDYLSQGQVIGIFPSGGVATIEHIWNTKAVDLPWKRFVVQLIRRSGASVLPIYFEGQNSRLFQWASHIRQDARLGLLLFELNNKRNKPINMTVGNLLPYDSLPKDAGDLLAFLYNRTFELATI